MPIKGQTDLAQIITEHEQKILSEWLGLLKKSGILRTGRLKEAELQTQSREFLGLIREALAGDGDQNEAFAPVREMLADVSRSRAVQGFTPTETATFVFSLKKPLFEAIREVHAQNGEAVARDIWAASELIDALGLETTEAYQKGREDLIARQQAEISELSTPVVKLWDGILALPIIGTLDSQRTQTIMENLLQSIVDDEAEIAIIDITGVPTVDTLVAQHLLKAVSAARLMGADCIVSGIRPQIAQTMVHLGVELNVMSKATLRDAFALALRQLGRTVVSVRGQPEGAGPRE